MALKFNRRNESNLSQENNTTLFWKWIKSNGGAFSEQLQSNRSFKFGVRGQGKLQLAVTSKNPNNVPDWSRYFDSQYHLADLYIDAKIDGKDKWFQFITTQHEIIYRDSESRNFSRGLGTDGYPIWVCVYLHYGTVNLKAIEGQFYPMVGSNVTYGEGLMLKEPYPYNEAVIEPSLSSTQSVVVMKINPQPEEGHTPANCHVDVGFLVKGYTHDNIKWFQRFHNGRPNGEQVYQCEEGVLVVKLFERKLEWTKYGKDRKEGHEIVPSDRIRIYIRPFRTVVKIVDESSVPHAHDTGTGVYDHPYDNTQDAGDSYCSVDVAKMCNIAGTGSSCGAGGVAKSCENPTSKLISILSHVIKVNGEMLEIIGRSTHTADLEKTRRLKTELSEQDQALRDLKSSLTYV